jgi:phage baseplate assembly protein W
MMALAKRRYDMLSKGNSNPAVCVNNLIQITRGENPYDRVKGVSFSKIDGPATTAADSLAEDAEWMIETYEPRAEVESIDVTADDARNGQFTITANIKTTKEGEG